MTLNGSLQIAIFCAILLALTSRLAANMTRVVAGERTLLPPIFKQGLDPAPPACACPGRRRIAPAPALPADRNKTAGPFWRL